jgi:hypothetical protein
MSAQPKATWNAPPPPPPSAVANAYAASISYQTEAINQLLAAKNCPSEFRPLIDYLIGVASGSTDWFEKSDVEVGLCARSSDQQVSQCAAKKYVQRFRKDFIPWEQKHNLAYIEFSAGGKDMETNQVFPSRYKLNIIDLAQRTVELAQSMTTIWNENPRRALELAAREIVEDTPQTPPSKPRFRSPKRDDEALLKRNPKTALTLLKEVRDILEARGEAVEPFLAEFSKELEDMMLRTPEKEQGWADGKITPIEARRRRDAAKAGQAANLENEPPDSVHAPAEQKSVDTGGASASPAPPVSTPGASRVDSEPREAPVWASVSTPPLDTPEDDEADDDSDYKRELWSRLKAAQQGMKAENAYELREVVVDKLAPQGRGMDMDVHTKTDDETLENFVGDCPELAALEVFESVGAVDFGVSLLHDPSPVEKKMRNDYEEESAEDFRANLPRYLEKNRNEQFHNGRLERAYSLAVRPSGERHFWLLDDLNGKQALVLEDIAFLIIETSPGSYQAWVALSDEVDLSDKEQEQWWKDQRRRLIRKVGGNGGSWGALRWPGTFNNKPERERDGVRPVVRIVRANSGRCTTFAELESLNLLASELPPPPPKVEASWGPINLNPPVQWPDWNIELSRSSLKKNGERQHSEADLKWCKRAFEWRWSRSEIKSMLLTVSPRAKDKTEHYIERTLDRAEQWAGEGGRAC